MPRSYIVLAGVNDVPDSSGTIRVSNHCAGIGPVGRGHHVDISIAIDIRGADRSRDRERPDEVCGAEAAHSVEVLGKTSGSNKDTGQSGAAASAHSAAMLDGDEELMLEWLGHESDRL